MIRFNHPNRITPPLDRAHLIFAVMFTVLLCAGPVAAQTTGSATLRGTVTDQAGAVVPSATVTLISERTNDQRRSRTNSEGIFAFTSVDPGTYTLRIEAPSFKTAEQKGLALSPSDSRGIEVTLEAGAPQETVTVTASTEVIQTETGAKENTITAKQIDNLSIVSRSALELLRILPGVVAPDLTALESVSFGGGANANANYNVNGLQGQNNNVSIDGSRVLDIGSNNGTIVTANVDMVQEVKVQTSNYAAEHGSSGIQISATTKGGTRDFHGTLYNYVRHHSLGANDASNRYNGVPRPESSYQYPGGNIGGPLFFPRKVFGPLGGFNESRDKLFFFVGFEVQRQKVDPGSALAVVPTLKQRMGDFSEFLNIGGQRLNQPREVTIPGGFPNAGAVAPNNNLAPYIDPIGRALINLYPVPNFNDPNQRYNYVFSALLPTNRTQFTSRFDYSVSDRTKLYVRLARESEEQTFARGLWWDASRYELPSHVLGTNLGRSVAVNLTNIINPTMTNEVLFSASKLKLDNDYKEPQKVSLSALGINNYRGFFPRTTDYAPVAIYSWGQGHGEFWEPGGLPLFAHNDSFSITDNLAKIVGTHTLKFGGLIEQANKKQNFNGDDEGAIILGSGWIPGSTGNDFGDLLVGRPAQFNQSSRAPTGNFRFYNYEFYAQDSWKIRPNFTLEYGLRFAYLPNNFERKQLAVLFDPDRYDPTKGLFINGDPQQPNGFLFASKGEIPLGITENAPPQWAPRLNFAWDISGKGNTVLRGGAGLFYNRVMGNYQYWTLQQPPNTFNATIDAYGGSGLGGGAGLTFNTLSEVNPFTRIGGVNIQSLNQESIFIPRIANMSLSVAQRLPLSNVLEVAYVGTQGRHLPNQRQINVIPYGALLRGQVGNADLSVPINRVALDTAALARFRPFGAYGTVKYYEYNGTSSYHSLQATLSRQIGKFTYFANYTWSKALGTVSSQYDEVDPLDVRGRSYGVLSFDRTHIFNMSYNWNLPDGARKGFNNAFTRGLLNKWQLSGITTFQTGYPIKLRFAGDISGANIARGYFGSDAFSTSNGQSGAIAPTFSASPRLDGKNKDEFFADLSKIGIPAFGATGPHQSPFILRSPARWNWDLSIFKDFNFTETKRLQFRAGFFNIFNASYANPNLGDIDLQLQTTCNVFRDDVPNGAGGTVDNVCDPTGGFSFTDQTKQNFGRIVSKHGRRIVELAVKFYF